MKTSNWFHSSPRGVRQAGGDWKLYTGFLRLKYLIHLQSFHLESNTEVLTTKLLKLCHVNPRIFHFDIYASSFQKYMFQLSKKGVIPEAEQYFFVARVRSAMGGYVFAGTVCQQGVPQSLVPGPFFGEGVYLSH